MRLVYAVKKLWHRVPLLTRLISVITLSVLLVASIRTLLLIEEITTAATRHLAEEVNIVKQSLPPVLIDYLIRGDYSSLKPLLQNQVDANSDISSISWQNRRNSLVVSDSTPSGIRIPAWFERRLGLTQSEYLIPLELGGVNYGNLTLQMDLQHVLYPGWQTIINQLRAVFVVILLVAVLSLVLFRGTLRGMHDLQKAASAFQRGQHDVRVVPGDTPELKALGVAFNSMAQQISDLIQRLHTEKELAEVTLTSIGDAVITTDINHQVTFLNQVASNLTGYSLEEALGKPLEEIFHVIDEVTHMRVATPAELALQKGEIVNLTSNTLLVSRNGQKYNIEDSAAPIHLVDGSLAGCVLVFHDVTEQHKLLGRVKWQAGHDVLTGLPNRILLTDRFEQSIAMAERHKRLLAVCLLDLDDFKPVNDNYGHVTGDLLLIEVTNRLKQIMRGEDTVARLGGDEFVLILNEVRDVDEVDAVMQRILNSISAPYHVEDKAIQISACIGVTLYPFDNADADTLLRHADQAMYQAKETGINRYQLFDVSLHKEAKASHQTLERIRKAIKQGELRLHYQPKVNLRTGEVVGLEALLRWMHPQDGLIPPMDFLPLIELSDLIVDVGEWVIDEVLKQLEQWASQGTVWPVSVNIAARHFQCDDFYDRLRGILSRHASVSPRLLEIEIVESAALGDIAVVSSLITACQGLGVTFSLDDFGTGYSSLSYLRRLPVDTLKIDQSFVRDMLDDKDDFALVEAVISMASLFAREVIAEGVETAEHGVLLMRLGCDIAQGFGIARPMPAEEIAVWAANYRPDPQWDLWADLKWEMSDLPLLVAQHAHLGWVKNVMLAVEHDHLTLNESVLTNHHQCDFGRWCYGHGHEQYGHLAEFAAIEPVHIKVHQIGTEIIRLRDSGNLEQARELCGELLGLKSQILISMNELQRAVVTAQKHQDA
jgi:diguanylate cyclase (GGDEF)-like protein/PAS domain S-box-containing protein